MKIELPIELFFFLFLQSFVWNMGIMVYFFNRNSWTNRLLSLMLLAVSLWAMTGGYYLYFPVQPSGWVAAQMAAGTFIGPVFYFFARYLVNEKAKIRWYDHLTWIPSLIVLVTFFFRVFHPGTAAAFASTIQIIDHKLYRQADWVYAVYSIGLFGPLTAGLVIMSAGMFRQSDRNERRRNMAIFLSVLIMAGVLFVFYTLGSFFKKPLDPNISLIVMTLTLSWIALSVIRHKAWKIETLLEIIRRNEAELAVRNQTIESELDLARLVQKKLLPAEPPVVPGLDISFYYKPMDKIGGDFYDYTVKDDRLGLIVADVSGHGIPGAFLATVSKMGFQQAVAVTTAGPELMSRLDDLITERAVKSMFVTAVYADFELEKKRFHVTNCGHCPPLIYNTSRGYALEAGVTGRPLGLSFGKKPRVSSVDLLKGDRVLLYTDGIVETLDPQDKEYGTERLVEFLRVHYHKKAPEFAALLFESLREFARSDETIDDISLVIVDVL